MTMLEVALEYAEGGALVLPLHTPDPSTASGCSCRAKDCKDQGKHPRTMHGKDDATGDLETVRGWWSMWPAANIGVRPNMGHVVVDIDPRNGGAVQFVAMQEKFGQLPPTRTAQTGSGGWHLWFQFDGDVVKELAPGIDLKNHGGYLVVPPSLHLSGNRYEWTNSGPIVPAPEFLARLIARPPIVLRPATGVITETRLAGLVRYVATAPVGARNRNLYWAACRAHEAGVDVTPLIEAAVSAGLDQRSAERTAESAAKAPPRAQGATA